MNGDYMATDLRTRAELEADIRELHLRLNEAEERLHTMKSSGAEGSAPADLPEPAAHMRDRESEVLHNRSYSGLYDFAPLGYVTLDGKGVIRAINLTGARLFGVPRTALIGTSLIAYLQKDEGRKLLKHLRQCKHEGEQLIAELSIIKDDGALQMVQLSTVQAGSGNGSIFYRTAITDITEFKKTEESLFRLNRLYALLSETGKAIVRSTDRDTLFHEICRVSVEHGGFLLAWIGVVEMGTGQVQPVASYGRTGYLDDILITAGGGPAGRGPSGLAIKNGTYCICNDFLNDPRTLPWHKKAQACGLKSSASVALKLGGETIGALSIYAGETDFFKWQFTSLLQQMADDISFALDNLEREAKRREAEFALRAETAERLRAVEELREKDRLLLQQSRQAAMGEMIGNIAHQWRQPLNAIGLCIQELGLSYELGKFTKEHLDLSVSQAMGIIFQMSQTIDDFRNFYKPDTEKRWFKIDQAITKTISLVEANFHEHRIALNVVAADSMEIQGYSNDYAQVLLNILMNARDVLLERRPPAPAVAVRAWMEDGRSVVTVTDNAGGIGEEIIERIFDPYFTTKENGLGTGIGLFMAKTIIENNMGGHLSATNSGRGAEFRIEV